MPQGTETAFSLVPLDATLGSEQRVHGRPVLGTELGAEGLQEEAHPLQAETATGKQQSSRQAV